MKKEFKQTEVDYMYIDTISQDMLDSNNAKPFWKYMYIQPKTPRQYWYATTEKYLTPYE